MDRVEFLHSIKSNNLALSDIVINFFDQYMLLYDLIDNVNGVSAIDGSNTSIVFELYYINSDEAQLLQNKILSIPTFIMYGSIYYLSSKLDSNTVRITITK